MYAKLDQKRLDCGVMGRQNISIQENKFAIFFLFQKGAYF
jgi:hypothetical protein